MNSIPDPIVRAIRSFMQSFIGIFLALTMTNGIDSVPDVDTLKRAGLAALWGGFVASMSLLQNAIEEKTGKAIVMK